MVKNNQTPNRNSWLVRIMSVVCACILWVYVMNEQNPITTKTFQVPLTAQNLSEDMVVKDLPETVNVKVSGTRSQIAVLREGDIKAFIDFTDAPKGRNTYNVQATTRMGEVAEVTPSLLQLETDSLAEKTMTLEPRIVGVPNSGVTVSQMDLSPTKVTIKGASARISQVDKVLVMVDISHHDRNFSTEATAVAVDRTGREMYDVKVVPGKIKTTVTIVRQLGTNEDYSGQCAAYGGTQGAGRHPGNPYRPHCPQQCDQRCGTEDASPDPGSGAGRPAQRHCGNYLAERNGKAGWQQIRRKSESITCGWGWTAAIPWCRS